MNEKSEQIDSRLNIVVDGDQPLPPAKIDAAILSALPSGIAKRVTVTVDGKKHPFIACEFPSERHAFLSAAVTFLGGNGNHPIFKKRIQLKPWFKLFTENLKNKAITYIFLVCIITKATSSLLISPRPHT